MYRYSTLDTAQRCLQKYKLQYIDGIKSDQESGDMKFGTAIHAGVQAILEGENGQAVFKMFWDGEKSSNNRYGAFTWESYSYMGPAMLERFKRLHSKHYEPFVMEQTMTWDIFQGTPDFVGKLDGIQSLVDFKTSRTVYDAAKLICNPQMYLYAQMAEKNLDYKIEQLVYLVFVKYPAVRLQTLVIPLDRELQKMHIENLKAQARELENRTSYPKNTTSCLMGAFKCEHFSRCWPQSTQPAVTESNSETSTT